MKSNAGAKEARLREQQK